VYRDAAHAMSPIGGVGINLAIQTRSRRRTSSPIVWRGTATVVDLQRVQLRRELPTRMTQGMQVFNAETGESSEVLGGSQIKLPWLLKLFNVGHSCGASGNV